MIRDATPVFSPSDIFFGRGKIKLIKLDLARPCPSDFVTFEGGKQKQQRT